MISELMLDSSILVEYVKERRIELLDRLLVIPSLKLYINALIIATAKLHGIPAIASHDADFMSACQDEGIQLIREVAGLA